MGPPHRLQHQQVAAVIIQYRQRAGGCVPASRTFEIHLPQLIGRAALKSAGGLGMSVGVAHQIVAQQNAMDGAAGKVHLLPRQQYLELARSPVGIAFAHLYYTLFQIIGSSCRTLPRTTAAFRDPSQASCLIALSPQTSRGTRNAELLAQGSEGFFLPRRRHYKPHFLFFDIHSHPRHPSHPRAR